MGGSVELHSTKNVDDIGIMTDKEFVLSIYPMADVWKGNCYYFIKMEGSDPWSGATKISEDRAWEIGRTRIEQQLLQKLES
jgi:hypothetical protein